MKTKRKKLIAIGVLLGMTLVVDQVLLYSALGDGKLAGRRIAPFDPPAFYDVQETALRQIARHARTGKPDEASFRFDAELGWSPPRGAFMGSVEFDWSGCRLSVAELERERRAGLGRILTLGCSFTLGAEVEDHEAWPYLLDAASEEHEFANLAMGAYGLDQALLRYRRDGRQLASDEVWLGWLPSASLRLLTVWRPAERHWAQLTLFKPRFKLGPNDTLRFVPLPVASIAQAHELLSSQEAFIAAIGADDYWISRVPAAYAPVGSRLLHWTSLGRLGLTLQEWRGRDPEPLLRDPDSEVFQLVSRIVRKLADEVAQDGARFRLIVLPDQVGLPDSGTAGEAYWVPLAGVLEAAGVEVVDCTDALLRAGAQEDGTFWEPGGHYSPAGTRVIADALAPLLER